jgi:hypothetical protein
VHCLTELYHRDTRYRDGHPKPAKQPRTDYPKFWVRANGPSHPVVGTRDMPPRARRPSCERHDYRPPRPRVGRVSPWDVRPEDVPDDLVAKCGFETARVIVARTRYNVARDVRNAIGNVDAARAHNVDVRRWRSEVASAVQLRLLRHVDGLQDDGSPDPAVAPPPQRGP